MEIIALILFILLILHITLNVNIMFTSRGVIIFYGRKKRGYLHINI